ncbi:probable multidrug resistance-associated protein lethal(2)03659 [Neocloeon triangulifer]|uniref:probable multidrug resistance-associated protein lethal(2)03659 n=1 Tax=Neocloeon triangulifer TaxID=2078957 RepID=UPI00286EFA81|nr:probable multidrug resistance-associated protein lethal(2)03659 [Neocloeon triangulifer]XP_059486252.1 probable multidrug resistance-associated protein lethal(2)03659 [Neocloeon triangulifer]XP_059486253.1 probable multidrug resistance-associated protein lethal(2)03659 [Neocloeon triangulifer]
MDAGKTLTSPHPRAKANFLSAVTFWWTFYVFARGYKEEMKVDDLYITLNDHKSGRVGNKLEENWNKEKEKAKLKNKTPSFFKAAFKTFGWKYMAWGIVLFLLEMVIRVSQPIFLGRLIRYFSGPNSGITLENAYLYAVGIIISSGLAVMILHPYMMAVIHLGMQLRVATCSLIYRKSLRLSHEAMSQTTAGQVVNLLSNDVNRFDVAPMFLHFLWIGPIETILCTGLMYLEMGWSVFIGIAILLATIPLQGLLGKKTSELRAKTAKRTDERVRLMNEIISGIQVIKMYTWEKPFAKLVSVARRMEIKHIRHASYIRGIFLSLIMIITRFTIFITIVVYVLIGEEITAEKVFVITAYYNIIRQTMTISFPQGISQLAECIVSFRRLQTFFMLDELKTEHYNKKVAKEMKAENQENGKDKSNNGILLTNAVAKWDDEITEPTLNNVTVSLTRGKLVAVIGPVGSGKTSLIHALLGELSLKSGSLKMNGSVSYAAQEPWLFAGSVKQNIIFGQPWDAKRYKEVVKVCALEKDFIQFPYGDKTVVGERGISLSGGQRARVALARAVYKKADVYLLDDPLSAVDAHVGRHLFDDCIKGYLKKKAVLLVTHQLQYLHEASHIIILKNGNVEAQGTYQHLQESGLDFAELLEEKEEEAADDNDGKDQDGDNISLGSSKSSVSKSSKLSRQSSKMSVSSSQELMGKGPEEVAEIRTEGTVSGEVYGQYLSAGGSYFQLIFMFSVFTLAQVAGSAADYWTSFWTNWEEAQVVKPTESSVPRSYLSIYDFNYSEMSWMSTENGIFIFTGLMVGVIVFSLGRTFLFFRVCMRASVNLHDSMFNSITRATMAFFNANPSGRVLNRFSKDMGAIDELLPTAMIDCLQIALALTGIIVVVAIVNVWLLLPTFVIAILFYFLRVIYLRTSRSVKRLEGVTRSPVFSHLNASIQGITTIRAFQSQEILAEQFDNHQDLHSSAWYLFISTSRSFGYWLDFICFIYIAIVTLSFLFIGSETSGGNVGLAITQALGLTGMFQWGMRQSAEMENQMTSVERVLEFSNLEAEPPLETNPKDDPGKGWPSKGNVNFDKLVMRYSKNDPPVLKGITFNIKSGEKIGVVGRTGAGKSSLISALFRLADCCEGRIVIDDIDTAKLGLHQLRANISIIPQEPVLFSGTMRKNLDPFDEFPDDNLWSALEEVELKEAVAELPGGLGAKMSQGGSNFSVGQRQLVCLARAIVRNNRILVLDEATANVDPKTDNFIQTTIRKKFAHCTVFTIAHRLHTIMDADRVLVMDAGRVAELAAPSELLADPKTIFAGMAQQVGLNLSNYLQKDSSRQAESTNF